MPQDRLRKLTDDNRELAANLRREATAAVTKAPPKSTGKTRRGQGSEFGSGRGSEERTSSVPAGGRGTKRARDNDIEKVCVDPKNLSFTRHWVLDSQLSRVAVCNLLWIPVRKTLPYLGIPVLWIFPREPHRATYSHWPHLNHAFFSSSKDRQNTDTKDFLELDKGYSYSFVQSNTKHFDPRT